MAEIQVASRVAYVFAILFVAFAPATISAKCRITGDCVTLDAGQLGKSLTLRAKTKVMEVKPKNWDAHALVPIDPIYDSTKCPKENLMGTGDWLYIETDQKTKALIMRLWLNTSAKLVTRELSEIGQPDNGFEAWRSSKPSNSYGDYDFFVYYKDTHTSGAKEMEKEYVVEIFPPQAFANVDCNAERPDFPGAWSLDWESKFNFMQISSGSGSEPKH